jgi:O-antigen/teichoic acid export membrane protein
MTLVSSLGIFGLGTLLIGDLPKRQGRAGLISAAMLAAAAGSLVLALGFVLVAPHLTSNYDDIDGSVGAASLFCIGVVLTATSVVFDSAAIGMHRGGLQLTRNMAFVITKMLTLIALATVIHRLSGFGIFASWIAATPLSLLIVAVRLWLSHAPILARPDWGILRSLGKVLVAHNWLNLALQVPGLLAPVLVASLLTPATNAAYYVAMTMCSGLFILTTHMSTALFAVAAGDPRLISRKLRFALRVSLLLGIPGMAVLGFGAHIILGWFGAGYAQVATVPMQLIALTFLPGLPTSYYISVSRASGRLSRAATVVTTFAALDVVGVVIGCMRDGLVGMAAAALVVTTLEAFVTTPVVVRAAIGSGRHRHATTRATAGAARAVPAEPTQSRQMPDDAGRDVADYRQQAGLALLFSMSTPLAIRFVATQAEESKASASAREPH